MNWLVPEPLQPEMLGLTGKYRGDDQKKITKPAGTVTDALVMWEYGKNLQMERLYIHGPGDDEILVEVVATGICHTDLLCMNGKPPFPLPTIFGHEGVGIIHAVGKNLAKSHSEGDQVILTFNSCGHCNSCHNDHPAYCQTFTQQNIPSNVGRDGISPLYTTTSNHKPVWAKFFGQSSFSRYALVSPRSLVNITRICDLRLARRDLQQLAPLGCGVQTGFGVVMNTLHVNAGSSIAIFGVGTVGLSAIMAAKIAGASTIIAIDPVESRLAIAKELGATHIVVGSGADALNEVKSIMPVTQGVQYAIDTSGMPTVIRAMMQSLGPLGKAAGVGMSPPGSKLELDLNDTMTFGRSYHGCIEGDSDPMTFIPYLVTKYQNGQLPLGKIIATYPASDCNPAIAAMRSGIIVKPVLLW